MVAWYFRLFRPDRVRALVNLSVHYLQRHPSINLVDGFRALLGGNFYICQFQEAGIAEADFGCVDTATMLKKFLTMRDPNPPMISKEKGFSALETPDPLPPWLTEEDIDYYATKFTKTGFPGGFNHYRAFNLTYHGN
ncbi:unnamed protein product [Citrullus colocynthis]|uniref:Uncharacterized protein n=1 Tax=Citrullus colocynthis TaxID=252529 RepID=A0ABP0YV05_9ROSI